MNLQVSRRQFSGWLAAAWLATQMSGKSAQAMEQRSLPLSVPELSEANNSFAFTLLKRLARVKPVDNQFLSPISIEAALSIAMEGARGQTALQMGQALQFPDSLKQAGAAGWDMGRLRTQYAQFLGSLVPKASAEAEKTRNQILELREQLGKANAEAQQLMSANKFGESNMAARQATKLAQQVNALSQTVDQFELVTANSLWLDQSYPLSKKFQQNVQDFYGSAAAVRCDFRRQAEQEATKINQWVADNTRDKIQNIIPAGALSPDTRLVIANAIYFKGNWVKPFDVANTRATDFTVSSGEKTQVQMMSAPRLDKCSYAAFSADGQPFDTPKMVQRNFDPVKGYPDDAGYQVLELPYLGNRLSMLLILPRRYDSLNKILEGLSVQSLANIRSALAEWTVNVRMPKFKMETNYFLIPELQALGMTDAFSEANADFTGLVESSAVAERLYISLVIHKAFVEVNEQGTEAAAATIVGMARAAAPASQPFIPEFTADRPFLAAIIDKTTNLVLFAGKVERPTS